MNVSFTRNGRFLMWFCFPRARRVFVASIAVSTANFVVTTGTVEALPTSTPLVTVGANGDVLTMTQDAQHVYIGGRFTYVGVLSDAGAAVNEVTGLRTVLPHPRGGSVRAVVRDLRGGWFIGGDFTTIGGLTRSGLARVNSSGVVTSWAPAVSGRVDALAFDGTTIYVGGQFTSVGGVARTNLAGVADATGAATSFAPVVNGPVSTLALDTGALVVGGSFSSVNGTPRADLARISTATGIDTGMSVGTDGVVNEVLVTGGRLLVAGDFETLGTSPRQNLGSINLASGLVDAFDPDVNGPVSALALRANATALFVGGAYSQVDGTARANLAAVAPTTGALLPWTASTNGAVSDLELSRSHDGLPADALLHAVGDFDDASGSVRLHAAAFSTATGAVDPWDPGVDTNVRVLARSNSNVFLGGSFTWINGAPRNYVAALDRTTLELDRDWNPSANAPVRALDVALDGSQLFIGGEFTSIDSTPRSRAGAVDATTGELTPWNPNANGNVRSIAAGTTGVYLGGAFGLVGGVTRTKIAAVNLTTGGLIAAWNPGANNNVNFLELSGDGTKLYAGGPFTAIAGVSRRGCAELDAAAGVATAFAPTDGGAIVSMDLSADSSRLWCSTGSNRTYAYAPGSGSNDPIWTVQTSGDVQAADDSATQLYIGGHFSGVKGARGGQRLHLASVDRETTVTSSWNPQVGGIYGTWAIEIVGDKVLVGGDFDTTGGKRQPRFAAYAGTP
jgi:hypothetical protein